MTAAVPSRWVGPWLFLRSRRAAWVLLTACAVAVFLVVVPREPIEVPLRQDLLAQLYLVVVPAPSCLCALFLERPTATLERRSSRITSTRAVWWLVGLLVLCLPVAAGLGATDGGWVCLRNMALLMGISTLCGLGLPSEWSWLPALAFVGACATYGTNELTNLPQGWALLLQPPDDFTARSVSAIVALAGWVAYSGRDLKPPS